MNVLYRFMELLCKRNILQGLHGVVDAMGGAFGAVFAHDHFRVFQEIAVNGVAVLCLPQMHPVRFNFDRAIPLLQEDNVRHYLCTGIGFEGGVGKPDSAQQLRSLGKVLPDVGVLSVHGIAAGHKGHNAAGTHLVQRLGEKIVVSIEAQLVVGGIVDLVLPKGYVANGKVKKVLPLGGFKAADGDIGLWVQLSGDPPADGIQLHTVQAAVAHFLREHTEEVAHAHRRLQDIAGSEAHISDCFIDGADDRGACVVGVQGRRTGGGVFLRGKRGAQFGKFLRPGGLAFIKSIRKTAPANVAG